MASECFTKHWLINSCRPHGADRCWGPPPAAVPGAAPTSGPPHLSRPCSRRSGTGCLCRVCEREAQRCECLVGPAQGQRGGSPCRAEEAGPLGCPGRGPGARGLSSAVPLCCSGPATPADKTRHLSAVSWLCPEHRPRGPPHPQGLRDMGPLDAGVRHPGCHALLGWLSWPAILALWLRGRQEVPCPRSVPPHPMLGSESLAGEGPNGARPQPCQLPATCLPPRAPPADPPAVRMSGRARLARTLTWGLLPGSLAQLVWCEGVGRPLSLRLAMWMASPLLESVLWVSESVTSGTGLALSGHSSVQEGPGACPPSGGPTGGQ